MLVVAHAPSVNTISMAESVVRGGCDPSINGVSVVWKSPFDVGENDVLVCDALILGTPENLGYMSGALKDFFDRIYYPCLEKTQGLPFAMYIRARHDGTGTRRAIESIAGGLRWRQSCELLLCQGDFKEVFLTQCEELGMFMAAGLEAGIL